MFSRLFLIQILIFSGAASAKMCKPGQGELAIAFNELRAKLAVTAGQCMGYGTDVEAMQFTRFLTRHKDWALKGDEWSGQELLKLQNAKGNPKTVGAQHYVNLIHKQLENSRSRSAGEFCTDAVVHYRQWVERDAASLKAGLQEEACTKGRLEYATTPSTTPVGN